MCMKCMSDQTEAMYRWEDLCFPIWDSLDMPLRDVIALADRVCTDYGVPKVRITVTQHLDNAAASYFNNHLAIDPNCMHARTVLHELVHHIFATGHGPDFVAGMLELYTRYDRELAVRCPSARSRAPHMGVQIDAQARPSNDLQPSVM